MIGPVFGGNVRVCRRTVTRPAPRTPGPANRCPPDRSPRTGAPRTAGGPRERSAGPGRRPEHAELVAVGIGQYVPVPAHLDDGLVGEPGGAQADDALDL